jgi:PAS domain S-box-containing protein
VKTASGEIRNVIFHKATLTDNDGRITGLIGAVVDITERNRTEEELKTSKKFFTGIVENMPTMVFMKEAKNLTFSLVNKAAEERMGMKREDLIGKSDYDIFPKHEADFFREKDLEAINSGNNVVIQEEELATSDQIRYVYTKKVPIFDEEGNPQYLLGISEDITELKMALREKDFLMKELNHRVKNNLNMVSALINLKNSSLGGNVDLSDLDNRINAIRLIHEKLYQTEDISHISLKEYIHELNENVFSLCKRQVEIEEHIVDISLSTKAAISLGLIVNEIATNAMKYGFAEGREAGFSVELTEDKTKNQYILSISNTGKPFPKDVSLDNPDTLGLQLISALVGQLEGTIELQKEPHPVFTIRFPMEEE